MRALRILILTLLIMIVANTDLSSQSLDQYRWENRLLIFHLDNISDATYQKQIAVLKAQKSGLMDRKLALLTLVDNKVFRGLELEAVVGVSLPKELINLDWNRNVSNELLLIGLDGGIKKRWTEHVPMDQIFDLIDTMPMRKREIERR